jgi:hypothetical protein
MREQRSANVRKLHARGRLRLCVKRVSLPCPLAGTQWGLLGKVRPRQMVSAMAFRNGTIRFSACQLEPPPMAAASCGCRPSGCGRAALASTTTRFSMRHARTTIDDGAETKPPLVTTLTAWTRGECWRRRLAPLPIRSANSSWCTWDWAHLSTRQLDKLIVAM